MPSLTLQVGAGGDDGHWAEGDSSFVTTSSYFYVGGYFNATYGRFNGYARFTNVTIPNGAIIRLAYLILTAAETRSANTVNATLCAVDADDAAAPTNYAEAEGAARTAATVAWNAIPAWTNGNIYQSPSLVSVIQEIVDRPGWASGNALVIYAEDNGSTANELTVRRAHSYNGSPSAAPQLYIEYGEVEISDTGTGADSVAVDRPIAIADTGTGVDSVEAMQLQTTGDSGSAAEALLVDKLLVLGDAGVGVDVIHVDKQIAIADAGTGGDSVGAMRGDFAALTQHPHRARLYLAVKQPRIVWQGTVANDRGYNTGGEKETDFTINITGGANKPGFDVTNFLPDATVYIGTSEGGYEHGKCRVRSFDGNNLVVSADMSCVWKAGDYASITDWHELWVRPHRSVIDGDTATFYKDWDITVASRAEYPVPIMGCDAAAFRDADTGEAVVRFDGSLSYKVQPDSNPYGGPGGLGWDNQGIASYAWWFEGGTPENSSEAAPVVTYDAAHPEGVVVRLTVTDRDGLTFSGFRYVFIFDRTGPNAPLSDFTVRRLGGSLANHGWEAEIELFGDTLSLTTLPESARCLLFAEEWFGDAVGSIPMGHAAITRRENVKLQGWLQDTRVVQDAEGVVSASAVLRGLQRYLERAANFDVYWTQMDDTVNDWVYFAPRPPEEGGVNGLTVRKALYHLIQWHYTLIGIADVLLPDDHNNYLAGHTFPGGHLGAQLDSFVKRIQAQWAADKTGALHVFSWPNWLPVMGEMADLRHALYQDVTFTSADMGKATIQPRIKEAVSAVRIEGTIANGSGYNAWSVDIAPGNSRGFRGSQLTVGQQILGTGGGVDTQGYELAMMRYVEESRREESVAFEMCGNYSCFDIIAPAANFKVTLAPPSWRGYSWTGKSFWVTEMDLEVDAENGTIGAKITAIPETKPAGDYEIWSQTGEVGFDGQDDPIATSGAFNDMLDTLERTKSEWMPALMGDGTSHVEGGETGLAVVRLWGDPSRTVLAENRMFKNVPDRPVIVEVVYNDSGAGRAGAPSYRVVAVDTAKDATADTNEARGYQYHRGVLTRPGIAVVGMAMASVSLPVEGESVELIGAAAYAKTAPAGADLIVALTVNGTVRATMTVAAGTNRGVVSISPLSLAIGDVLDFNITQVGSTTAGAGLTVTAITREYGL